MLQVSLELLFRKFYRSHQNEKNYFKRHTNQSIHKSLRLTRFFSFASITKDNKMNIIRSLGFATKAETAKISKLWWTLHIIKLAKDFANNRVCERKIIIDFESSWQPSKQKCQLDEHIKKTIACGNSSNWLKVFLQEIFSLLVKIKFNRRMRKLTMKRRNVFLLFQND